MALSPSSRPAWQSLGRLCVAIRPQRFFSTIIDESITPLSPPVGSAAPAAKDALENAGNAREARTSWSKEEISEIYNTPLMELAFKAVSTLPNEDTLLEQGRRQYGTLIPNVGNPPPSFSLSFCHPNVYPHEHQDRRL